MRAASHREYRQTEGGRAMERASARERYRRRRSEDPIYGLRNNVSSAVRKALRAVGGSKAGQSTFAHLPYTPQDLRDHLESLWEPWMTWGNYGIGTGHWTIDHIVPQSAFRYTSLDDPQFRECWALSNLRPLEFMENVRKGDRVA